MRLTELEETNGCCQLKIEVAWEDIAADYRELVARYAATVSLPGFRPGKVPVRTIEQYCRKKIMTDLAALVVQRFGPQAVLEAEIKAFGPLEATEIECVKGKPFRAILRCYPMPEFTLPHYADLVTADNGASPHDQISRRLLELVRFPVPEQLIHQELARDGLEETNPDSEAWFAAEERIRLLVILKRIARQEGIEVDDWDMKERIAEKANEFGTSPDVLQAQLEHSGGMARFRDLLLAENTLEYLLETVNQ